MENGCEHTEGSPIGKCSICEKTVCRECYREVFNAMICDLHQVLEDESNWELVGLYNMAEALTDRRYALEDGGITSLVVEADEDSIELYVPTEEREDAFTSLAGFPDYASVCKACRVQVSSELESCPLCGVAPTGESDGSQIH